MNVVRNAYLALVALFLVGPIIVISSVSFNSRNFLSFPPKGFSFRWFVEIFANEEWFSALTNSVVIAFSASLLAVAVALPVAYAAWRYGIRYAKVLLSLGIAPFILPPVIMALAFLLFFTTTGMYGWFVSVVISHTMFLLALPLVTISLGLESIDRNLIEASHTLGADDRTVFRTIILPMALPYAIAGFAFCFVLSLNEYIIALMTVGFTYETLPIKIFNAIRYGYTPVIASIAVLFLVVNVVIFGLIAIFGNLPRMLGALEE